MQHIPYQAGEDLVLSPNRQSNLSLFLTLPLRYYSGRFDAEVSVCMQALFELSCRER